MLRLQMASGLSLSEVEARFTEAQTALVALETAVEKAKATRNFWGAKLRAMVKGELASQWGALSDPGTDEAESPASSRRAVEHPLVCPPARPPPVKAGGAPKAGKAIAAKPPAMVCKACDRMARNPKARCAGYAHLYHGPCAMPAPKRGRWGGRVAQPKAAVASPSVLEELDVASGSVPPGGVQEAGAISGSEGGGDVHHPSQKDVGEEAAIQDGLAE